MGSYKVAGKSSVKPENCQIVYGAIFSSKYHTKQLKFMTNLTRKLCGDLQLAVCLSRGDGEAS